MTVQSAIKVANDPRAMAYDELEALETLEHLVETYSRMMSAKQLSAAERLIQKLRKAVTEDLGGI